MFCIDSEAFLRQPFMVCQHLLRPSRGVEFQLHNYPITKLLNPPQFSPFILSFTLRASFSISSAFFSTSTDSTFSFDLST